MSQNKKTVVWKKILLGIGLSISLLGTGFGISVAVRPSTIQETGEVKTVIEGGVTIELTEKLPTDAFDGQGELDDANIYPYVESVDGGQFMEITGAEAGEGEFAALGAIEAVDTSSPEAFVNSTLGRCIIADNVYGAQCVSLQRAFWLNYAGYDITTCGTGVAKGEVNCPEEIARDKFTIIRNIGEIISGTWIVTDGSWTGHVCFVTKVLGNGYVTCLGENQGGHSCGEGIGGSATNLINLSTKNFLIGFIPNAYKPLPNPEPILPDTSH